MGNKQFRTGEELARAQWAEKYVSVAEGKLYTPESSPFPVHEYFKLGLLGKNIRMLEVNAGYALVEHMVADTLTNMTITVGSDATDAEEQKIHDWFDAIDFEAKLEEAMRYFYGVGHGEQQVHRTIEGQENGFVVSTIDPSSWYPTAPTFVHESVKEGRIISVFQQGTEANKRWYAFVEHHRNGEVEHKLYRLDRPQDLDGVEVPLSTLSQFSNLQDIVKTDLARMPIVQIDRAKPSRNIVGTSVLQPIWGILQEVSEIQTQIRQERIKHFRSKMYVPRKALVPIDQDKDSLPSNSKATARNGVRSNMPAFSANQEIFPIETGDQIPGYIQWDMQMIVHGSNEIDKLLSRAASIVGCPRSVFNLDEKGTVHVDTERRKDRRYVAKILQGQKRAAQLVKKVIETWAEWNGEAIAETVKVSFASPFDLSQDEAVKLMREMNPEATFVSEEEAIKQIWKDKNPEERQALMDSIESDREKNMANIAPSLSRPVSVELP